MEISVCYLFAQSKGSLLECSKTDNQQNHEDDVEAEEEGDEVDIDVVVFEKEKEVDVLCEIGELLEAKSNPSGGSIAIVGYKLETLDDDEHEVEVIADLDELKNT